MPPPSHWRADGLNWAERGDDMRAALISAVALHEQAPGLLLGLAARRRQAIQAVPSYT